MSEQHDCGHVCCADPGDPFHRHPDETEDCPSCEKEAECPK